MCSIRKSIAVVRFPLQQQAVTATIFNVRRLSKTCDSGDSRDKSTPAGKSDEHTRKWSCNPGDSNPSIPTMYDSRKYGHRLPSNEVCPAFESLKMFPTGIFRTTIGEKLGPGAAKKSCYQCPEYFSYQHMTYYDIHMLLRPCRKPCPQTGRRP